MQDVRETMCSVFYLRRVRVLMRPYCIWPRVGVAQLVCSRPDPFNHVSSSMPRTNARPTLLPPPRRQCDHSQHAKPFTTAANNPRGSIATGTSCRKFSDSPVSTCTVLYPPEAESPPCLSSELVRISPAQSLHDTKLLFFACHV
jgi:hypothetical protein